MTIDYRAPPIEQQVTLLARTLPDGRLWNAKYDQTRVFGRVVAALASEISRLFARIADFVLVELDPTKTRQLLLEWERSVGIPDECFDRSPDLTERRRRVVQKLNNFDDIITREDIEGLLLDFGEEIQIVPGNAGNAELLGFPAPPYDTNQLKQIKHTVAVRVEADAEVFPLDFPIPFATEASDLLRCLLRRVTPANVALQFFFNENLSQPFGGPDSLIGIHTLPAPTQSATAAVIGKVSAVQVLPAPTQAATVVAQFLPTDIAGLELWFDAQDSGSITETSGEVSQWDDGSTAGNDVVQGTGANQPNTSAINGNDSLFFDGTDERLRDASPTIVSPPGTLAVVFTPTSVAAGVSDAVRLRNGFDVVFKLTRNGDDLEAHEGQGGAATVMSIANNLAANETRWAIARFRNSGDGTSDVKTDEGDTASASVAAAIADIDDVNIGANASGSDPWLGHIHEVIYWNRFLTDGERDQVDAYLDAKWSLS